MAVIKTVEPSVEPVTLAEAKAHCRVEVADDDAYITALITAVRQVAEQELQRTLTTSTYKLVLPGFTAKSIELPYPVLQSVTSLKYWDAAGVQQTMLNTLYRLDTVSQPGSVTVIDAWPATQDRPDAVEIIYVAGWINAAAVPQSIKHWMLMRVETLYDARADFSVGRSLVSISMPFADSLLDPHRVWVM
jgi:uncharacterized phiE125 gp8 family phage protein